MFVIVAAFMLITTMGLASCTKEEPEIEQQQPQTPEDDNNEEENTTTSNAMDIKIGNQTFTVTLADNSTSRDFKARLPMTMMMNEINSNEKYCYLSANLPTNSFQPEIINAGDLLLYGSNCVVLFYETFSSSYSYTLIGRVDNPTGLSTAVGTGDISVSFEMRKNE